MWYQTDGTRRYHGTITVCYRYRNNMGSTALNYLTKILKRNACLNIRIAGSAGCVCAHILKHQNRWTMLLAFSSSHGRSLTECRFLSQSPLILTASAHSRRSPAWLSEAPSGDPRDKRMAARLAGGRAGTR
jgi:hypothetical protein